MAHTPTVIAYGKQGRKFRVHWLAWLLIASVAIGWTWVVGVVLFVLDKLPPSWSGTAIEDGLAVLRLIFLGLGYFTLAAGVTWGIVKCFRWWRGV